VRLTAARFGNTLFNEFMQFVPEIVAKGGRVPRRCEYLIPAYADIIDVQTRMLPELDTKVNKFGIKGVDGYGEWSSGCGERSWSPAPARRFPLA
jgi:hypothetical protein